MLGERIIRNSGGAYLWRPVVGMVLLVSMGAVLASTPARAQIEVGTSGNVGIGTAPSSGYKLDVECDDCTSALTIEQDRSGSTVTHYGVSVVSRYGMYNYGIKSYASSGTSKNYGVYGRAYGTSGTTNYGIYGYVSGTGTKYAGYFNGDVTVTGTFSDLSDERLKRDIVSLPLDEAMARVLELRPRRYRFKDVAIEQLGVPEKLQFGFIAQEVEPVIPQLVEEQTHTVFPGGAESSGLDPETGELLEEEGIEITFKTLDYVSLIPVLTAAIQQQQVHIDLLIQTLVDNDLDVPAALLQ